MQKSLPSVTNIMKKSTEKNCEAGKRDIASGYAIKASPGPDLTTS
jgi:hypothetical protein